MGGLEIRNKFIRCSKCLEIKRITLIPEYPEPKVKTNCRCSEKEEILVQFYKDLKKKEDFKIKCAKCQTEDPKEPKYCYQCQKIYCVKCCDFHSQLSNIMGGDTQEKKDDINALIGHKVIDIEKVDFHCILHQDEKFIGFCRNCLLNYCAKCQGEKLHEGHKCKLFANLLLDKKKKENIKIFKKFAQNKISYNHKVSKMIRKKIKNKDNKNLIESLSKENDKINEKLLEFFDFLYEIYDKLKHKDNYSVIYNVVNNLRFNVERLKFDKDKNEEEDAQILIEYLKSDFVMHNEQSLKKMEEKNSQKTNDKKEEKDKGGKEKEKEKEYDEWEFIERAVNHQDDEKYNNDSDGEEEKKEEEKKDEEKEKKEEDEENKNEIKEETKKEKKEREKKEKEEKAKKEKEDKEKAKKEKEEKAKKEKEDKEKAKREEKEKKEREKKEKEEKAKKEKEDKEKAKKEEKEKAKREKEEKAKKEKEEKEKSKKEKEDKKNKDKNKDKDKKDNKDKDKKDDKVIKVEARKRLSAQPALPGKLADKMALFQQKMSGGMMGMGRPAGSSSSNPGGEKQVKIEHTRNEGDTVEIINNIQVGKTTKKKPKKINFEV